MTRVGVPGPPMPRDSECRTGSPRDETPTMTTKPTRIEKLYVLFGSQTGNSEQAAQDFCQKVPEKLSPSQIQALVGNDTEHIVVEPVHMQLDDFLELEQCQWTRLFVIFTSSYGVGQAPLGCYRFRELCDAWLQQKNTSDMKQVLKGHFFAMCGLGDSKYTTFFQNPKRIDEALQLVGATRVGPLGKADASGKDEQVQGKVIEQWIDGIWPHLAKAIAQEPVLSEEDLRRSQQATLALCRKINPDLVESESTTNTFNQTMMMIGAIVAVILAVVAYFLRNP